MTERPTVPKNDFDACEARRQRLQSKLDTLVITTAVAGPVLAFAAGVAGFLLGRRRVENST